MEAPFAFEREPYRTELETNVIDAGAEGDRRFAVLEDTILYPEGGGQPADRGAIGDVAVLDVQKRDGQIRHYVSAPVAAGPVRVRLDWARRFDHMQQHTGQHLLSAVAEDRFGWATAAFHLGERLSDVELAAPGLGPRELGALEETVAAEIRAARAVTPRRVSLDEYGGLTVRSRGLPEGHTGDVRLVEIAGVDLNTCGGTHLSSTSEIESLALLSTEALRGGTRVVFVAGGRVRRRLLAHEERNAALRALIGAADEELVASARQKLEQRDAAERRARRLEETLASTAAESLSLRPDAAVEGHFEDADLGYLSKVAKELGSRAPEKAALLTARQGPAMCFLVAAGERATIDVAAAGREIAALLGGRGGGSGRIFQGKAGSLDGRAAAFERLRAGTQ